LPPLFYLSCFNGTGFALDQSHEPDFDVAQERDQECDVAPDPDQSHERPALAPEDDLVHLRVFDLETDRGQKCAPTRLVAITLLPFL